LSLDVVWSASSVSIGESDDCTGVTISEEEIISLFVVEE
jgi:hypothetical protein